VGMQPGGPPRDPGREHDGVAPRQLDRRIGDVSGRILRVGLAEDDQDRHVTTHRL